MTALLTNVEAGNLHVGVNVIVRPGDRCECARISPLGVHEQGRCVASWPEREGEVRYPPQDWVALTGPCPTCGGRGGEWEKDGPHDRWETCPDCIESLTLLDGHAVRTRRIVPLYTECQMEWSPGFYCDGWIIDKDGDRCGRCDRCTDGRVMVGRGSIEVVPVVKRQTGNRYLLTGDPQWLILPGHDAYELALDPLPVPGRDFGIVIDCVEITTE